MYIKFICGCETKDIVSHENLATMDMVDIDTDGFIICKIHKERRYGWRSNPFRKGGYPDHSYDNLRPLEMERLVLYGEPAEV